MKKVLVLEDESSIRSFIVINLRRAGYDVIEAESGEEALERLKEHPDTKVALLDIMLPGIDGFEVCRRIRATGSKMGIIMLTAKSQEIDKVTGLMTGADDYVTKPFGMMELVSRIKAVLRRSGAGNDAGDEEILALGEIAMDTRRHQVTVAGEPVALTLKEYELLKKLLVNSEVVLTRDQLLEDVWGYDFDGETRTVDVHIRTLRQKLGQAGDKIETVRGVGYRIRT